MSTGPARPGERPPRHRRRPAAPDEEAVLRAARSLSASCPEHAAHMRHVERLALQLFDGSARLHRLGRRDRFRLQCAALLHDIGWLCGRRGHHKTSLRMILDTPLLPLARRERLLVASVARYHRRALPSPRHGHYARLSARDRRRVRLLAGLLRVADGLDAEHTGAVEGVACEIGRGGLTIRLSGTGELAAERGQAAEKGDLLTGALRRSLSFPRV